MPEIDYYRLLGVQATANAHEIKQAYRRLVRQCHPDLHMGDQAAEEHVKILNIAAAVLTNPAKRASYDRLLHAGNHEQQAGYDVTYSVLLSWREALTGTQRRFRFHTAQGQPYDVTVDIPANVQSGTRIQLIGQGGPSRDGVRRGDFFLVVMITEKNHADTC
jgi:DnaJ-class molecular chaperone